MSDLIDFTWLGSLIVFGATAGGFIYTWYKDQRDRKFMHGKMDESISSAGAAYSEANAVNIKILQLTTEVKRLSDQQLLILKQQGNILTQLSKRKRK